MFGMIRALWSYRGFIFSSIRNEFAARFVRSRLGGLWMIIHPLAQVSIYALILSAVLAAKLPGVNNRFAYAIYLASGMIAWSLFLEVISRCLTLFIEQGHLLKKMVFPRVTLPAIAAGSCLLNHFFLLVATISIFLLLGHPPGLTIFILPALTILTLALALGLGLMLGVLNVFIRDIGQVVPILLQFLFWFTPIVYPIDIVPEHLQKLLAFNPMSVVVASYHDVLVYNRAPDWFSLTLIAVVSGLLLFASLFIFRRASAEMVDVL